MLPAFDPASRPTPGSLTPQAGSLVVRGKVGGVWGAAQRRCREWVRAEPTSLHFVVAAALYWAVPSTVARLTALRLPHDDIFSAVVYLMWSGSAVASEQ